MSRRTTTGMRRLFRQFSFPGRHPQPRGARRRPGSIHEGGELGYSLAHAYGAAFDNPDLLRRLRRRRRRGRDRTAGDRLALEQVPEPGERRRRAADPAPERLQDRQPHGAGADGRRRARAALSKATATHPYFVEGDEPEPMHRRMAAGARPGGRRDPRRSSGRPRGRAHASGRAGR